MIEPKDSPPRRRGRRGYAEKTNLLSPVQTNSQVGIFLPLSE